MEKIKRSLCFMLILLAVVACKDELVQPSEVKAELGESFTVSAPSIVSFQEAGIKLHINEFTEYPVGSISSPHTSVKAVFEQNSDEKAFEVYHYQSAEGTYNYKSEDLEDSPEQVYREVALLNQHYILVFEKVNWEDENASKLLKVKSGQFLLKVRE